MSGDRLSLCNVDTFVLKLIHILYIGSQYLYKHNFYVLNNIVRQVNSNDLGMLCNLWLINNILVIRMDV